MLNDYLCCILKLGWLNITEELVEKCNIDGVAGHP